MKRILVALAMLVIAINAFASIEGPDKLKADCFSEVIRAQYTITNDFSEKVVFTITIEGIKTNFDAQIIPEKLELGAGESGTVALYIKPCCWTKPGVYTLALKASSRKGDFTKKIEFEVIESRKVSISIEPKTMQLGQCEEKSATITVENKGPIAETVILSLTSETEIFELSTTELYIKAGSKKEVTLNARAPCKMTFGKDIAKISARIKGTEIESEASLTVEFVDKQKIEIEEKTFEACNDIEETKALKIKNAGRAKDELRLSMEGPAWLALEQKTLSIDANEEAELKLKFKKVDEEGDFNFIIKAYSTLYDKETTKELNVSLKDCYKVTIEKVAGKEKACIEEKTLNYTFRLSNEKATEIKLALAISGLDGTLDKDTITLRPKEEVEVKAKMDIASERPGKKTLTFKATSAEFSETITTEIELEDCYALSVDASNLQKEIKIEVSPQLCPQSKLIVLEATNTGTKEQEVKLSVSGIKWIYLEPKKLELKPAETKEFYLYIGPSVTEQPGSYTGKLLVEATDYKKDFSIKVDLVSVTLPEKVSIAAEAEIEETIIEQEKTVKAKIKLQNTSDCVLEVLDINVERYNVEIRPETFTMDKNASVELTATIYLGKGFDQNTIKLPLVILTDRGIIKKTIAIDLVGKKVEEVSVEMPTPEETEAPAAPAAQVVAMPIANIIVLLFLAVVAIVIIILAYYAYTQEKAREEGKGGKK
jgi:uncharacterized cupredoxin-like copper-binding protein